MKTFTAAVILTIALFVSLDAAAGMRCPSGRLAEVGMDMFKIKEICGEPKGVISDGDDVVGPKRTYYYYKFTSGGYGFILEFRGVTLISIRERK